MAALITPTIRNFQPQQAMQIDWSNPITRGLVGVVLPNQVRELVTSTVPTFSGAVTYNGGLGGYGRSFTAENSSYEQYAGAWSRVGTGTVSHLTCFQFTNTPAVTVRLSGNFTTTTNGYGFLPNTTNLRYATARSGANSILSGNAIVTNKLITALGVTDATNNTLYENGRITAGPTAHGTWTAPTGEFRLGLDSGGAAAACRSIIYLSLVWNRALSDVEARSITLNPWQIFMPQPRKIWVLGGGTSTYTITPSGGIAFSGAADISSTQVIYPTGALTFSGDASMPTTKLVYPDGGISFTGTAQPIRTFVIAPTGEIVFSGDASIIGPGGEVISTRLPLTGVGT